MVRYLPPSQRELNAKQIFVRPSGFVLHSTKMYPKNTYVLQDLLAYHSRSVGPCVRHVVTTYYGNPISVAMERWNVLQCSNYHIRVCETRSPV